MDIRQIITRQYQAPLQMLQRAIDLCPEVHPEDLWFQGSPNRFWHVAHHALFYTHFYLAPSQDAFLPWELHREGYNFLGAVPGQADATHCVDRPYSKAELHAYAA